MYSLYEIEDTASDDISEGDDLTNEDPDDLGDDLANDLEDDPDYDPMEEEIDEEQEREDEEDDDYDDDADALDEDDDDVSEDDDDVSEDDDYVPEDDNNEDDEDYVSENDDDVSEDDDDVSEDDDEDDVSEDDDEEYLPEDDDDDDVPTRERLPKDPILDEIDHVISTINPDYIGTIQTLYEEANQSYLDYCSLLCRIDRENTADPGSLYSTDELTNQEYLPVVEYYYKETIDHLKAEYASYLDFQQLFNEYSEEEDYSDLPDLIEYNEPISSR
jgi:hypothetical protein